MPEGNMEYAPPLNSQSSKLKGIFISGMIWMTQEILVFEEEHQLCGDFDLYVYCSTGCPQFRITTGTRIFIVSQHTLSWPHFMIFLS